MMSSRSAASERVWRLKTRLFRSSQMKRSTKSISDLILDASLVVQCEAIVAHQGRSSTAPDGARSGLFSPEKVSNQMTRAKGQLRRRCSMVSMSCKQMGQTSLFERPCLLRRSPVQHLFHATFQAKNLNFNGAFYFKIGVCKGHKVRPSKKAR